jgi:hypothetical protein
VSLLILVTVPLMAGSAIFVMTVNTKQTERKNKDYAETGGIVYTTVSTPMHINSNNIHILQLQIVISYFHSFFSISHFLETIFYL